MVRGNHIYLREPDPRVSSEVGRLAGEVLALEERRRQLKMRVESWEVTANEEAQRADELDRELVTQREQLTALEASDFGLRVNPLNRDYDLDAHGIPRVYLSRLLAAGKLNRVGRDLYSLPDGSVSEYRSLAEACKRVPRGVVCLLSALRFHELTTQAPPALDQLRHYITITDGGTHKRDIMGLQCMFEP